MPPLKLVGALLRSPPSSYCHSGHLAHPLEMQNHLQAPHHSWESCLPSVQWHVTSLHPWNHPWSYRRGSICYQRCTHCMFLLSCHAFESHSHRWHACMHAETKCSSSGCWEEMSKLKCVFLGELTSNAHAGQPFLMSQLRTSQPSAVLTLLCSLRCTSEKLLNACEKSSSMEWLYLT